MTTIFIFINVLIILYIHQDIFFFLIIEKLHFHCTKKQFLRYKCVSFLTD